MVDLADPLSVLGALKTYTEQLIALKTTVKFLAPRAAAQDALYKAD
jgi:hypothetical protein